MGRLSKREQEGGGGFRRFRSQIIFKYTSAVRSKIGSSFLYACSTIAGNTDTMGFVIGLHLPLCFSEMQRIMM